MLRKAKMNKLVLKNGVFEKKFNLNELNNASRAVLYILYANLANDYESTNEQRIIDQLSDEEIALKLPPGALSSLFYNCSNLLIILELMHPYNRITKQGIEAINYPCLLDSLLPVVETDDNA